MPFCRNCGSQIVEGAGFCRACGTKVNATTNDEYRQPEYQPQGYQQQGYQDNGYQTQQAYQNVGYQVQQEPPQGAGYHPYAGAYQAPVMPTQPQKSNAGLIIGVAAVIVFVVVMLAVAFGMFSSNQEDDGVASSNMVVSQQQGQAESQENAPAVEEEPAEVEEESQTYVKGTFTDSTYESKFIGVRYTTPVGWVNGSESELATMPQDNATTWELQTKSSIDGSNVLIAVEKLPSEYITMDIYINSLKNGLKSEMDIADSDIQTGGSGVIAGKSYDTISYSGTSEGVSYKQTFYLRKVGGYMVAFTVTTADGKEQEILKNFVKY